MEVRGVYERLRENIRRVVGKDRVMGLCLISLLGGGYVLLTDAGELDEPGGARLGEIYLYARFRNAVPAELVEEFGRPEPEAFAAAKKLEEASKTRA